MSDECQCECHQPGHVILHATPCCLPCPTCGKNIAAERAAAHAAVCVEGGVDVEGILKSALAFYADPKNWNGLAAAGDDGELARRTLAKIQSTLEEKK